MRLFGDRFARRMTPGIAKPWTASGSRIPEAAPPDLDAARLQYECAAEAGDSDAMSNLGYLYVKLLEPRDLDAARHWYERAADTGNSDAMSNLGVLYGHLMQPPDRGAARHWY